MEITKYAAAVDLTCDKFGLPDFAYQAKVVSDSDKEKACEIISGIKDGIADICANIPPGRNNVIIPFSESLKKSLPKQRALDMTIANRFFGFLSLLSIINSRRRPRIAVVDKRTEMVQTIPFVLFEDLKEAISLMRYAEGIRPYVLEWFYDVFVEAYNVKTVPDSRVVKRGKEEVLTVEVRKAVSSQDLVVKTKEIYDKTFIEKNIVDHYVTPLINQGYIDSVKKTSVPAAELDWRLDLTAKWEEHILPDKVNEKLIALLNNLGLHYGCVDMRQQPDGTYKFFEVNPSGQFLFVEIHTGQPILRSLAGLLACPEIKNPNIAL